jgi:hypothetical protein
MMSLPSLDLRIHLHRTFMPFFSIKLNDDLPTPF